MRSRTAGPAAILFLLLPDPARACQTAADYAVREAQSPMAADFAGGFNTFAVIIAPLLIILLVAVIVGYLLEG